MMSTVDVSMPKLISTITLRVRFARVAGVRLWLASRVIWLAGVVAGCDVQIETPADTAALTERNLRRVLG